MIKTLQALGDRLVDRLVPTVTAEAGVQDYTVYCFCGKATVGSPYTVFRRNCAGGSCADYCFNTGVRC